MFAASMPFVSSDLNITSFTQSTVSNLFSGSLAVGFDKIVGFGFNNQNPYVAHWFNSSDGITYTNNSAGFNGEHRAQLCFGTDRFVSVSGNSAVGNTSAVSFDGINWTQHGLPSSKYWYALGFGAGKFLAGAYADPSFAISSDGINWTNNPTNTGGADNLMYGNGVWICQFRNSANIFYSANATSWTASNSGVSDGIQFNNGLFFSRRNSDAGTVYRTSTDGASWTVRSWITGSSSNTFPLWNGSVWICSGIVGGLRYFHWSPDLVSWNQLSPSIATFSGYQIILGNKYVSPNPRGGTGYVVSF